MATKERSTAILDVHPILRGSEKAVVEAVLARRPGVERVEANPVAQTATVTYDPAKTSLAELRRWIQECGLHCAGQSVPEHICDPLLEPDPRTVTATTRPPPTPRRRRPSQSSTTGTRPPLLPADMWGTPLLQASMPGTPLLPGRRCDRRTR